MAKVLVTGATGFIGRFLVSHLLKQSVSVRILVRNHLRDDFPATVQQFIGDLAEPNGLIDAMKGIDIVFHLAGYAHAWKDNQESAAKHHQTNLIGTKNCLEASVLVGVKKFIFFSTIKAVGDSDHCIDEKWNAPPDTPYGKAKRAAEAQMLENALANDMHVCVLRLALVYGPHLKGNLYQMLRAIDKGYFLPVPPVKNHHSLISVYDVCQAAWLAANCEVANGKIYFLAEQKSYSTYQIYSLMRKALGYSTPTWSIPLWVFRQLAMIGDHAERLIKSRLPFNSQAYHKLFGSSYCSANAIQHELGFCTQYALADLLPQIITTYRAGKT
ncbi:MAG: hypothetical protein A3F11_05685 [Gammaproteobacteria bacterium RIFCSPHIGHO2_12_FULL_37_14]|nr:MAG: hypothetical protein A3F11_05685 [Gammaproteobacteria bacterium RIFCSPHIGHO2_12_FULL_37_14]